MKKNFKAIIASILVFSMVFALSSCKQDPEPETTTTTASAATTSALTTVSATTVQTETLQSTTAATTVAGTTAGPAETQSTAPVNGNISQSLLPDNYTKEQALELFNTALNKVKTEKPAFTKEHVIKLETFETSVANTIVNLLKPVLFPEKLITTNVSKGENCDAVFPVEDKTFASRVTMSDIQDITVTKEGENYVLTVTMPETTNPENGDDAYGRIFKCKTRQDAKDEYAEKVKAKIDLNKVTMRFNNCSAKLTLNPQGQVIHYYQYIKSTLNITGVEVMGIKDISLSGDAASVNDYLNFVW